MTEETCADCLREAAERPETLPAPVHEGMGELDREAERIGRGSRGFKFHRATRQGSRGRRSGRQGGD